MPLFRFVFEEGAVIEDMPSIEFPDYDAAIDAAKKAARETMIDAVLEGHDPTAWLVRIYNEPGDLLKTVFVADLLRPKTE
ncbi:MAG: hypothetical protein AAAB35_08990 [Phyllobacterium sp.]|uniref:DUF6894 family protein n=1 Tax=Phyllobacterium sp. TaxID=1871046 RepID=UPI0030F2459D